VQTEPQAAPVDTVEFDHRAHPRKVNVGCGWDKRPGYLNVDLHDFHEPDLVADIRDLHMLPSGAYTEVVAQDVLEHLPRADAMPALREWARLLEEGGQLVVRVPNLVGLLGLLTTRRSFAEQEELVQCAYGTQAYNGDFHINGFTEITLRHLLHDAGFDQPAFTPRDGWLFDLVAVRREHPEPVDTSSLAFMAAGPAGGGTAGALERARAALAVARSTSDLGPASLGPTRLRSLKRVILRLARVVTHRQEAHNRAVDSALEGLIEANRGDPDPAPGS